MEENRTIRDLEHRGIGNLSTEPVKEEIGNKWDFLKDPLWVKSLSTLLIVFIGITLMLPTLDRNLMSFVMNLTLMQPQTLFVVVFLIALISMAVHFLIYFWTAGITFKIVLAKLQKRKMEFDKSLDNIYDFVIVRESKGGLWLTKKTAIGINKVACGWLKNGVMIMPTLENHCEGIAFEEIVDHTDKKINTKAHNDLINAVRVEERKKIKEGFLNPQNLMVFGTIIIMLCIGGYLLMSQVQTGQAYGKYEQCMEKLTKYEPVAEPESKSTIETLNENNPLLKNQPPVSKMVDGK